MKTIGLETQNRVEKTYFRFSSKKVWFFMIALQNIFVALTYPSLYR